MTMRGLARLPARLSADPRLLRVVVTAAASYAGRFGSGIVVLVTIPMARAALDPELFGTWMMLTALLGFFNFADLGVGNGVLNKVTQARAAGDGPLLQRVLTAGYACTMAAGVLLLAAWGLWVVSSPMPASVAGRVSAANAPAVLAAFTTFATLLAINIPAALIQKAQLGYQQGYWIGLTQLSSSAVTLIAVPWILRAHGPLFALVLATLGVQALANIASTLFWLRRNLVFQGARWRQLVDAQMLGDLLRTGSHFLALQLAVAFAFQSDAIVITQKLGQAAYGDFAVVQKLFLFVSMVLGSAMLGLWPAFGDAMARGDVSWARKVLVRAVAMAGTFASLVSLLLVACIGWITSHWLKTPFAPPLALCAALGTWTVIDAMGAVSGNFMNGANLVRVQVVLALAMAGTAFAGKWLLVPLLGPTGAVLATLIAYCAISIPGQFFIYRNLFSRGH